MPGVPLFTPALFRFLRQLKKNNRKDWFMENKGRYEKEVRDPLLQFIADFAPKLAKISPHYLAIPHPTRGSMFRIYRDTRFAKDKSPYKTVASAHFRHEVGKDVHGPGFYLHLEPGNVFAGAGIWRPDGRTVEKVRGAIVERDGEWKKILSARSFKTQCTLEGESLKRPPRGFDPDHPLIHDLKRKDFVAVMRFTEAQAVSSDFLGRFTKSCRTASRFMEFLSRAVGLPY